MSSSSAIALIALLAAVLLFVIAIVVWQEARSRPSYEPLTYVVEDAVKHVEANLENEDVSLSKADIRRILEWEVYYLQGLAQGDRRQTVDVYAGGVDASVRYIVAEIADKHGVTYSEEAVRRVLHHEADYLLRIGAIGDPVTFEEGEEE